MMQWLFRGTVVVVLVATARVAAVAGVPDDLKCKDAKIKATGARAVAVLNAVSANMKKPNVMRMERRRSRAHASFTKLFARAESKGGCATADDASAIGNHVDEFVAVIIDDLASPGVGPTTTSTSTTTSPTTTSTSTTTSTTSTSSTNPVTTTTMQTAGWLVINEIDYDQVNADDREFVELFNPGGQPVDVSGLALVFVNGADESEYLRVDLSPGGEVPPEAYLVVGAPLVSVPAATVKLELPGTGVIQNGPDGVVLIDTIEATVLDAFSYEGEIRAATVAGLPGPVDLVEGNAFAGADSGAEVRALARHPNGVDTDDASLDWAESGNPTPGAPNPADL